LEENNIIIQQAYYGEVNRAHSCINQTINDSGLTSFLIAFTDRPAALPPGVKLMPYLSGVTFSPYYVFTKTFSDPFATRAGMVFTHVLIFNLHDIQFINNLEDILSHFFDVVPKERAELKTLSIDISDDKPISNRKFQPHFIQQTISSLIKGTSPILFSGNIESFKSVIQQIWNFPNADLRKKLKFRTSFTPSDIQGINDLTIVSIQKEFLSKWSGQIIIQSENKELVEITSHSEALFLGYREENPFYSFLVELNVNQTEFQNFGKFEKVFNDYSSLGKTEDANNLRLNIRILSQISSSENDGKKIKEKFIDRLEELIRTAKDTNLKALRNIEWKAFKNGETKARKILSGFIKNELKKNTQTQIELIAELLDISFSEKIKNWWHNTIQESFKNIFLNFTTPVIKNIWKLLDYHEKILNNICSLLPITKDNESHLRKNIPANIKEDTIKALEIISRERKWYLLHADILLKYLQIDKAVLKQIEIEKSLRYKDSIGVKYLTGKMEDKEQVALTLLSCDNKLIHIAVERILKNKNLLKNLDVRIPCWLNIWSATLEKTENISNGIEGREQEIVCSVLDLIINGKQVPEIVIELTANSAFTDISNYEKRDKVWSKIPVKHVDSFLNVTSREVLNKFLLNKIDIDSIEKPLADKISSDAFMTNFLSEHRNNIEAVIKCYEFFANLKDNFLSDFVEYYRNSISDTQSIRLGTIVNEKKFSRTARTIYNKSKYNLSFNLAFEHCKDLVNLSLWESLIGNNSKIFKHKQFPDYQQQDQIDGIQMSNSLPIVVILTAIQEEYCAVRNHLKDIIDVDKNDTSYEAGIFEFNKKEIAKVIIRECGAKNTIAAQEAERAIQNFKPECMFFVGIAGSRKPNDFSVGDVIFPEKTYSYEGGKSEKDSFKARPDLANSDYALVELAKKERRKNDWKVLIKNQWEKDVKADLGIIASGEQIVDHYNSGIGKILTEHFNDTSAVEMEGFGFAKAVSRQGRETNNILVGIVRGISDIIEQPEKNPEETNNDRRSENAKQFASDTAAAFAFWLIFKTYEGRCGLGTSINK